MRLFDPAVRPVIACVAVLLAASTPARAASILPTSQDRTILADATADAPPQNSTQSNGDGALGFEPLDVEVDALAPTAGATGEASADQASMILDDKLWGSGTAEAIADASAEDGFATAFGDSFFRLTFEVDETADFLLTGLLTAGFSDDGFASAQITLTNLDTLDELVSVALDPLVSDLGEVDLVDESGTLESGFEYELLVFATADAAADILETSSSALASFEFELELVPEPGAASLLLAGLALCVVRRGPTRPGAGASC